MISFTSLTPEFVEPACRLYEAAFPVEERRPTADWIQLSENESLFNIQVILYDNVFAGIITTWRFQTFTYVEHFAVVSARRGSGIGAKTLARFVEDAKVEEKPLVLEVELAETGETARRRIGFYERFGFTISSRSYRQPAYRRGETDFPLSLMTTDGDFLQSHFDEVRYALHTQVYGLSAPLTD